HSPLDTLEAQAARIRKLLAGTATAASPPAPTPERIAAEAALADATRELHAAERALDDALSKFTDIHPTVLKARARVDAATQRVRLSKAALPPDSAPPSL